MLFFDAGQKDARTSLPVFPYSMDELQWTMFEPGDEPEVLTADLCAASGGCENARASRRPAMFNRSTLTRSRSVLRALAPSGRAGSLIAQVRSAEGSLYDLRRLPVLLLLILLTRRVAFTHLLALHPQPKPLLLAQEGRELHAIVRQLTKLSIAAEKAEKRNAENVPARSRSGTAVWA
jgi:hypothetical protein